jgi:hypothetical protein
MKPRSFDTETIFSYQLSVLVTLILLLALLVLPWCLHRAGRVCLLSKDMVAPLSKDMVAPLSKDMVAPLSKDMVAPLSKDMVPGPNRSRSKVAWPAEHPGAGHRVYM